MNNSSTALGSDEIGLTDVELWIHLTVFYVLLCGILSTLGNCIIVFGITKDDKLKETRFFVVVIFLTICRTGLCVQYLMTGVFRILRTLNMVPTVLPRVACHAIHIWLVAGMTLEMALLLLLVVDRALAIAASIYYRRLTRRHAVIACSLITLVTLVLKLPASFIGYDLVEEVPCVNSYSAPTEIFNAYSQNVDLFLVGAIFITYLFLLIYIDAKIRRLKVGGAQKADAAAMATFKRQLNLMPVLRNLVVLHCTLAVTGKVLRALAGMDALTDHSARLTAYGGLFTTVDLFANMVALLIFDKAIRKACLPMCLLKRIEHGVAPDMMN